MVREVDVRPEPWRSPLRTSDWRGDAACSIDESANKGETAMTTQGERRRAQSRWADPKGEGKRDITDIDSE